MEIFNLSEEIICFEINPEKKEFLTISSKDTLIISNFKS